MGEARRRGTCEERRADPKGPPKFRWPKKWFYRMTPTDEPAREHAPRPEPQRPEES